MDSCRFDVHVFDNYDQVPEDMEQDAKTVIQGLRSFNLEKTGIHAVSPIRIFIRDQKGQIKGGLLGNIFCEWVSIDILWVS